MAAADVMTETHEINGMQHAFVHGGNVAPVPAPDPASTSMTSRKLLQTETAADSEANSVSPSSSKSKPSSSDASQPLLLNTSQPELTPPSSAFSSQEQQTATESHPPSGPAGDPSSSANLATVEEENSARSSASSPSRGEISRDVISERKRTASGQVKRSSISSIHDLKTERSPRHSRTSSIISHGSTGSVMELSQQLRTRLTYAMVKVQNGWQTRSLDEVESLASQSPRSTTSGFPHTYNRHSLHSPRTAMTAHLHRTWSSSSSSDDAQTQHSHPVPSRLSYVNSMQAPVPPRRGLAPPADIVPGSRRRAPHNGNPHEPFSPTKQLHSARPAPKLRTPSQNAAMEADAVETLLFMASPNNSGHHPPTFTPTESSLRTNHPMSLQTSPLRSQFNYNEAVLSPKKVAFMDTGMAKDDISTRAIEIERMLDESDEESSDELDHAIELASMAATTRPVR